MKNSAQLRASGAKRAFATSGIALCIGALVTAAAVTGTTEVTTSLDGHRNTFDIQATGSLDSGWTPTAWPESTDYVVSLGEGVSIRPGEGYPLRVAVRNASPRVPAALDLRIVDDETLGLTRDPATGLYRELFDQLLFTVSEGGTVLIDSVPGTDLDRLGYLWFDPTASGQQRVLDVVIALPETLDESYLDSTTGIRFLFTGHNVIAD